MSVFRVYREDAQYTFAASETSSSRSLPQTPAGIAIHLYPMGMTTEDIEKAVEQLSPGELARFRARFEAFDSSQFDAAIERDAQAGKLDGLAEKALAEHRARKRRLRDIAAIGERRYDSIKEILERDHFGGYVMVNTETSDYIVGPTISQVHAAFTERFGEDAPSWSTRIGVSIFGLRKFAKLPFTNL